MTAEHGVLAKETPEESSKLGTFINVLNKACETELVYSTEDHCEELEKYKYILRRALIEFKQLIKEINTAYGSTTQYGGSRFFSCFWLSLLELELKYSFIRLVPFMKTRLDVPHDDFVSAVHDADMSMEGYCQDIHANFKEKFIALGPEMIESLDELFQDDWPCSLAGIARFLLREWACTIRVRGGDVIVCPSSSALVTISSDAIKESCETGMELKRWMDERVFPLLSNKLAEYAGNVTVFIETEEKTGELAFLLESACPDPAVAA